MIARDFGVVEKNTLRGFFALDLDSGITLLHCALQSWISLPSKPQLDGELRQRIDPTGKRLYTPVVEFRSKAIREKFMAQALAAVEALRGGKGPTIATAAAAANSSTPGYGPDNYPRGVERASAPKAATRGPADELPNDPLPW